MIALLLGALLILASDARAAKPPNNAIATTAAIVQADASAMPSTTSGSLLAYMNTPWFLGPADSTMPQSSQVVGVYSGGTTISGISIVNDLQFTADGGMPAIGQTVCLAGADDDLKTAQGKATATCPSVGVPFPDYLPNFQIVTRSRVEIGTVLDNSNYLSNGTASVLLQLPAGPRPARTPGSSMQGYEADGFTSTKYFSASGNQAQLGMAIGESIDIMFTVENTTSFGNEYLAENFNAGFTNGWALRESSGRIMFTQFASAQTDCDMGGGFGLGLHQALCSIVADGTAHGGSVHCSLDGGPVAIQALAASVVAPASGWTFTIGGVAGLSDQWAAGGIVSLYKFNRTLTDTELQADAASVEPATLPTYLQGRWIINPTLAADGSMEWQWRALDWIATADPQAVIGPAGGSGITFTTAPSAGNGPAKVTENEYAYRDELWGHVIDSDQVGIDSLGYMHARPGANISWTQPSGLSEIGIVSGVP